MPRLTRTHGTATRRSAHVPAHVPVAPVHNPAPLVTSPTHRQYPWRYGLVSATETYRVPTGPRQYHISREHGTPMVVYDGSIGHLATRNGGKARCTVYRTIVTLTHTTGTVVRFTLTGAKRHGAISWGWVDGRAPKARLTPRAAIAELARMVGLTTATAIVALAPTVAAP